MASVPSSLWRRCLIQWLLPLGCAGPVAAVAGVASADPACTAVAVASPADRYKREVACHLHSRNTVHLYQDRPPPMLRSVVVLSMRIDERGRPLRVSVLRSNGIRALERRAMQSVRDASPLPAPQRSLVRNGRIELIETWLFRDDGRFQIRTLAQAQADSGQ
jgi:protein TonB